MSDGMNDLRNEAKELTESFSPAVHARVMAKVRAEAKPLATRQSHLLRYALGVAAVIVVVLVVKPLVFKSVDRTPLVAKNFAVPNPLSHVAIALNDDGGDPAYGYLDHDAKALGKFVIRQLDSLPPASR
jgi:hypothetical protein